MAYSKQTWVTGETITASKLNHLEDGVAAVSANGAIGTANLANASVTNAKLDQEAVDTDNIRNGAITTPLIYDGAVTSAKIADGAVTAAKLGESATDIIADTFSTSTAYSVGDYCIYNGALYRFTADKTAGAWDSTKVTAVALADDVEKLDADVFGGTFTFTKTFMSNNRYSTNRIYNAQASNIGKKLSEIYSAATTNTFAYMLDVTLSKSVKFPTGASSSTSNYGCLAFDKDDVCVWTRQYTAGDVAGNMIEVTLPINATKMLLVFGNSLNALGTEYVVELTRYAVAEKIAENKLKIDDAFLRIGNIVRGSFAVNANGTHSSNNDRLNIDIPANTKFVFGIEASESSKTSLAQVYAIKASDSSFVNIANIYPYYAESALYEFMLDYEISGVSVFYRNDVSSAVNVRCIVAFGNIEIEEIYDATHEVGYVNALSSNLTKGILSRYESTSDGEVFAFYSDPHYLGNNGDTPKFNNIVNRWLEKIETLANAVNAQAVICGGDVINAEQTDADLCYKLAAHNAIAKAKFGNKYHLALGNHDTRFDATQQSIFDNMLFADEDTQKAYFSVKTPKTRFYFLNTGTDQVVSMNAYRWEQLQWLADKLRNDADDNRILVMHIVSNDASTDPANFGNSIVPMANNALDIINAFNVKGSVSVNGATYDFSAATGKVRCVLCGHMHYDTVYTATGGIPVICIDDATAIGTSANIVLDICFADYDNGKLYAYREGAETREIDLA